MAAALGRGGATGSRSWPHSTTRYTRAGPPRRAPGTSRRTRTRRTPKTRRNGRSVRSRMMN